jgi:hypothetical protein
MNTLDSYKQFRLSIEPELAAQREPLYPFGIQGRAAGRPAPERVTAWKPRSRKGIAKPKGG